MERLQKQFLLNLLSFAAAGISVAAFIFPRGPTAKNPLHFLDKAYIGDYNKFIQKLLLIKSMSKEDFYEKRISESGS